MVARLRGQVTFAAPTSSLACTRSNQGANCPTLQAPEDPPTESVPANDGRGPHIDHRIAPITESGEYCRTHASRVIDSSGLDVPLDILSKLSTKDQILSADGIRRMQEQDAQPEDVGEHTEDCVHQAPHALIMPDSTSACSHAGSPKPCMNDCAPQARRKSELCIIIAFAGRR